MGCVLRLVGSRFMKGRATTSLTWLALKTEHVLKYFKSQPFIESHQHLTPNAVLSSCFF